jgi:hypothetical protein
MEILPENEKHQLRPHPQPRTQVKNEAFCANFARAGVGKQKKWILRGECVTKQSTSPSRVFLQFVNGLLGFQRSLFRRLSWRKINYNNFFQ